MLPDVPVPIMQMIIASRLTDGRVVFMDEDGGWVDLIGDGVLLETEEAAARSLADAERGVAGNVIVDPYLIGVIVENEERRPAEVREAIRAFGPSVRTDLENPSG